MSDDLTYISIADLQDKYLNDIPTTTSHLFSSSADRTNNTSASANESTGQSYQMYSKPGSFLTPSKFQDFSNKILEESYRLMGLGSRNTLTQTFLTKLNRTGAIVTPLNSLNYGFTFITRPRLNLGVGNLVQHPILSTLGVDTDSSTLDPTSVSFMMRALMDTRLCRGDPIRGVPLDDEALNFSAVARKSPLIDVHNPFFVPLCNGLTGISGFPDFNLREETTEGDFHSGDFTWLKGGDMNNATQELSLEFRDIQGSIILSCFYYWCVYMALQAKGVVRAYDDDIYEQRLNYTVSIYRFVMDPSRTQILWWAKATGCFPKSAPVGAIFNVSQGENMISSAQKFSIPFAANDVKVNDPGALFDFNVLMRRYCPTIADEGEYHDLDGVFNTENFIGLPYIKSGNNGLELVWRVPHDEYVALETKSNDNMSAIDELYQEIAKLQEQNINTLTGAANANGEVPLNENVNNYRNSTRGTID